MLDLLIVGSGPAGLSAAIYGKRANLDIMVLEKMPFGIGQIAESNQVDNYLGLEEMNGYDLGMKFREHAVKLGVEFRTEEAASYVFNPEDTCWQVGLAKGESISARAIVYAAGAVHRHLNIAGEQEYAGSGVSYCATCDGAFFRGKQVAVIGGGDTALNDALYLSEIAQKVYVVHRRAEFRGATRTVEQLKKKENVEFVLEAGPEAVLGENGLVSGLRLVDGKILEVQGIFVAVGMAPLTGGLAGIVELDDTGYVIADETGVTSAKGFFVAGDVRRKALRQVVTAVADGANAATSAEQYIRQNKEEE